MEPVRSCLVVLCAIAGAVCLAPKAVSDPHVQSGAQPGVRQSEFELQSGIMLVTVKWAIDPESSADVLSGHLEFRPQAERCGPCRNIRFIQAARVDRDHDLTYDWSGLERNRNLMRTPEGFFLDHRASACLNASHCSPYFRDHWPNPRESRDGFVRDGVATSASLVDYPYGWDVMERISLESCARCAAT
jgi:hypothetical protein